MVNAEKIITELQLELRERIKDGAGPFLAAIYKPDGTLVAKAANSVLKDNCSHCHAEMNAIKAAEKALGTYDLSKYDLSLYVTAEPCVMCMGGIMWSGIKAVYYGVPSKRVEEIAGFDEGYKPGWIEAFAQRGIKVEGGIAQALGEDVLRKYVEGGYKIYKPERL